jgi:hypothetical protein
MEKPKFNSEVKLENPHYTPKDPMDVMWNFAKEGITNPLLLWN